MMVMMMGIRVTSGTVMEGLCRPIVGDGVWWNVTKGWVVLHQPWRSPCRRRVNYIVVVGVLVVVGRRSLTHTRHHRTQHPPTTNNNNYRFKKFVVILEI
jgi:hypothetical protein